MYFLRCCQAASGTRATRDVTKDLFDISGWAKYLAAAMRTVKTAVKGETGSGGESSLANSPLTRDQTSVYSRLSSKNT